MYHYNAKIIRWIDGDTFEAVVDLGFFVSYRASFRVRGIDTPEITGATKVAGKAAKDHAEMIVPSGSTVPITTHKPDKYGRWLADITVLSGDGIWSGDFAAMMIASNFAVPSKG